MDERHWWFASKLQETFHFGGYDNPTLLEDFLSESSVIDLINSFLAPGEPHKLFFYCDAPVNDYKSDDPSATSPRQLRIVSQLSKDVVSQGCVCLYILRRDIGAEVDVTQMEKYLFCGELRHSVLSSLASLLTEVYTPLLHSQRNWGECSEESVANFLQNFDKFSNSLLETAVQAQIHQTLLRRPGYNLRCDLAGQGQRVGGGNRGITLLSEVLMECEALVSDWISTIESILLEATDERLEDSHGSPLAELTKWQRRQTLLFSLVEQLKAKESKSVLGALVATKSKLLKKWKSIDVQECSAQIDFGFGGAQSLFGFAWALVGYGGAILFITITDAFNNTRDRVRYLEALAPHLETLASCPPLLTVVTATLPSLATTMKQMEGLSRSYARSGYLGILFIKISNCLVQVCKDDLESYCTNKRKEPDHFWSHLAEAILSEAGKTSCTKEHPLIAKLNTCLTLSTAYKEMLSHLKDTLLQQQHGTFGLSTNMGPSLTRNAIVRLSNASTANSKKTAHPSNKGQSLLNSDSNSSSSITSNSTPGISLHNMDMIMSDFNAFSARVLKILDVISTLAQFRQLNSCGKLEGLPRIAGLWTLPLEAEMGQEESSFLDSGHSWGGVAQEGEGNSLKDKVEGAGSVSDITMATPNYLEQLVSQTVRQQGEGGLSYGGPLPSLKEESTAGSSSVRSSSVITGKSQGVSALHSKATNSMVSSTTATTNSGDSTHLSQKGFSDSPFDSVAVMIEVNVRLLQTKLENACSRGLLDVFSSAGKSKTVFLSAYDEYASHISRVEEDLCAYLRAVFADMGSSSRALDIISKFAAVSSRIVIKEALHRCTLVAFSKYSVELEGIQAAYEKNKGSPPLSRNAPPVAGVVSWARQLLRRIEEPMQSFKSNSAILQSNESLHVCKLYNRLATALLKYETLWLNQWRGSMEGGRAGLKATLLIQQERKDGLEGPPSLVMVNCQDRLLELMAEAKALLRLGVTIPDPAKFLLTQKVRVKHFKQQLEHVLDEFYTVQGSINHLIRPLLASHIEGCVRSLLPGWTTLTWSSMNIDAFLYRVKTSVASLKILVEKVDSILKLRVYKTLDEIASNSLFDLELATSKAWHPDQFSKTILASVADQSNILLENVFSIRTALIEIITLTSSPHGGDDNSLGLLTTALQSSAYSTRHPAQTSVSSSDSSKKTSTIHSSKAHINHSGRSSGIHSTRNTSAATLEHGMASHPLADILSQLGPTEEAVLGKFCELVFDTVSKMVLKSHEQLCSCLWASENSSKEQEDGNAQENDSSSSDSQNGKPESGNVETKTGSVKPNKKVKVVTFDLPDSSPKGNSSVELESELINSISQTILLPEPPQTAPPLQLEVEIHFLIPTICLRPSLEDIHSHLSQVSAAIVRVLHQVTWWVGQSARKPLYDVFEANGTIQFFHESILQAIEGVTPKIEDCLRSLRLYDFLWQQDMHTTCRHILSAQPKQQECSSHIENFILLEEKIDGLRSVFTVGPLQLSSKPVKNSLRALAVAWKIEFASFLHEQGKSSLKSLVTQREGMLVQLASPVTTLEHLKSTLELLHTITDMQNVIDEMYLPVERLYALLREYNPHLPRSEVQQVDSLRDDWKALTDRAEQIQYKLLSEQRLLFEREVDKQVKAFVVETIQFRNSFDSEGPLVPGLIPSEAVSRLGSFLEGCEELKSQRDLLAAVQKLLDIPPTPYTELDQTEQDLSYLRALYGNYQHFIDFDKRFRQELWAEVDLDSAVEETERFWSAYESLPLEQQEWDASRKLRTEIIQYKQVLPLLKNLHSKEVRNRHWLQVMHVVNCTFQLEGSIFKMTHLLDAGLLLHIPAIQEIVHCAQCELDLEEKFYSIEEEWSEAVLLFRPYKSHGHALLDKDHTLSLLEQLEHARTLLATMLMSKHISPLREEASQWAVKLANMADVLQQWMTVQEMWQNLEAVFNTPTTAKEFPEEAVKFASIHKRWIKLMRRAYETRGVLQCCTGGEIPRTKELSSIGSELEECKKSLSSYLFSKRQVFPRLYYVSDDTLLSILSNPTSVLSIQSHLGSLFGAAARVVCSTVTQKGDVPAIIGIESAEGERLDFSQQVPLSAGVEHWISQLLSTTQSTLHEKVLSALKPQQEGSTFSLEECAHSNVTQVASMALYFQWTKDCEHALTQCRYDRRALPVAKGKFGNWAVGKLTNLLMRNAWKIVDEPLTSVQRVKLEAAATFSLWMRDIMEDLCHHKLKDVTDFEWQRYIRPYLVEGSQALDNSEEKGETVVLRCLDQQLCYGYEYTGCSALPVFTPRTDNYVIALTQALSSNLGSLLIGPTGSGKVQIIKGIGQLCGRFVFNLHCYSLTDKAAIGRTFEGLAQDGSWVCFSDIHTLTPSSLSVVSQMMHTIRSALQARNTSCQMRGGKEITVRPQLAVFLTFTQNPSSPQWQLPPSLSHHFRTFSLAWPDSTILLRAKCSALGLRAPKALANKLVSLQNMVKDQFSHLQATLTVHTICHVLETTKRKLVTSKVHNVSHAATRQTPDHTSSVVHMITSEHSTKSPGHEMTRLRGKPLSQNASPSAGQTLPAGATKEHTLVAQTLLVISGPMFPDKELPVFTQMVKDVFAVGVDILNVQLKPLRVDILPPLVHTPVKTPTSSRKFEIPVDLSSVPDLLREEATRAGLVPSEPWIGKVEQLFMMTQLKHAVIMAGKPATGKSSALNMVVSALTSARREDSGTNGGISNIKVVKIYPGVFEELSDLYGYANPRGDWVDGVFTDAFRKAHKATQTVSWVCLDGEMSPVWVQCLPELLGKSKTLTLGNGEHLFMSEGNLKFIFETGCLDNASPACLLNCGIVYFDSGVLGWRTVAGRWCSCRSPQEADCLRKYLDQVMDPIVEFVLVKAGQGSLYSEVGLLETCLAYLSTLLNIYRETAEVFSEVHVERLLLFSLIWSYGGVLVSEREQRRFSQLLKTLTNILPDDDSEFSVFDYYVDESGEWDVWQSRVPQEPTTHVDMLGSVFVDTADTIRTEVLLELALAVGRHTLLVGPHGAGKTTICKHFLQSRALLSGSSETMKQTVFNGYTGSAAVHEFMQVNFHHRQGYTFGPKHRKKLRWFIDDLHLPLRHTLSDNRHTSSYEYLRQLSDASGLYNLQKRNEWCAIEDLVIVSCLTSATDAVIPPRLRRQLAVVHLPELTGESLKAVVSLQLFTFVSAHTGAMDESTLQKVVGISTEVYSKVRQALKVSGMPGRQHYIFSLRQLESAYQGLCYCADGSGEPDRWGIFETDVCHETPSRKSFSRGVCQTRDVDHNKLGFSLSHEMKRAFTESICHVEDEAWLTGFVESQCSQTLPQTTTDGDIPLMPLSLSGIPTDVKLGEEQSTSSISPLFSLPEVVLHPVSDWSDLHLSLSMFLRRYREEFSGSFNLELSDINMKYIMKLHRALKFPRGNSILVGALGLPLHHIATFALYIAGYSVQTLDTSKETSFKDGFRTLFRQAGLEGKPVSIILSEQDITNSFVMGTLNSFMACGELPTLFTNDEMDGLLQALGPSIKRDFPSEETDSMQYFIARIYRNLRVVLCLPPTSSLLGDRAHDFKGIVEGSMVIWMRDWTKEFMTSSTKHFLMNHVLDNEANECLRDSLYNSLSAIHCYVMKETSQLTHTGQQPGHLQQTYQPNQQELAQLILTSVEQDNTAQEDVKFDPPSSLECLISNVLKLDRELSGTDDNAEIKLPYVGPTTYLQFIECFCDIYQRKSFEQKTEKINLSKALETIGNTQQEVEVMKTTVKELRLKHEEASHSSSSLLQELTAKSCQLERLKALLGQGSSVLSAMQMVGEQERLLAENEEDDEELLALFVDRRSSRYDTLLQKAKEQLHLAEVEEQRAKQTMMKSKEKALHWQNKIDRNTIDQIKSLNSPPRLVGTIMELMFTLLRQYGQGDQQQAGDKSDPNLTYTPGHTSSASTSLAKKRSTYSGAVTETAKMEKEQWLAVQSEIGDSQKFLDLLKRLKWEEGLSTDAVNLIESKLATSSTVSISSESDRQRSSSTNDSSSGRKGLITVSMARHAAECAASMCEFATSIVNYSNSLKPYNLALKRLQQTQHELQELEASAQTSTLISPPHKASTDLGDVAEEGEIGEDGLAKLQLEVDALQEEFDKAVIEKHSLGQMCHQLADRLKTANHLLESLKTREESWQRQLDTLPTTEVVVTNCILAAAFTTYCSALKTKHRYKLFDAFLRICKQHGLPSSKRDEGHLLSPSSYPKFMIGEAPLYHFIIEGLPSDLTSQQNGCIITYRHSGVWPLILDPMGMVEEWLANRETGATVVKYKHSELHSTVIKGMQGGNTVIITDVDSRDLASDKVLTVVMKSKRVLQNAKSLQKVLVADKEIECDPNFKLYMVSSDSVSILPPSVASVTSVVMFQPEREGLKDLLLDSFLLLQNPKTSHDREQVRQEIHKQAVRLMTVENELLKLLVVQERDQTEEPKVTKAILLQNKTYDDAHEGLTKALSRYSLMNDVHLSVLHSLASQASVVMDVVSAMGSLMPLYETSYTAIQSVFLMFVEQAGSRIQGEDSLIKMTRAAYSHFVHGYFEEDRLLFSLLLALEIEISRGTGTKKELEFLVSPTPGHQFLIKGLYSQANLALDTTRTPAVNFGKKPFDWMSDSQWQMLLKLSSHFSWVHEIIERQGRDGKEAVWRTMVEGSAPETINISESIGYKLPPLHQMLIMYAMRPERISQCIVSFISTVLDSGLKQRRLNYDTPVDLNRLSKTLEPDQIPLVIYRKEPGLLVVKLEKVAQKMEIYLTVCHLHDCGEDDYDSAVQAMQEASSKGHWLLLHHVHNCPNLVAQLPSLLHKLPPRQNWKLWLSTFGDSSSIPMTPLRSAYKVVLDSPLSVRSSVLHSLSSTAGELINSSARQEWLPLLHNMAMLHASVRMRKHAYKFSWAREYQWTQSHLMDTLVFMSKEFKYSETTAPGLSGVKPISWSGMRHMIVEVFYGSAITDSTDISTFAALADHWIHPGGPRREAGRYHISSQFFVPNTKLTALKQAVENASPPLVFTAEMCGFHCTPLIQLGWEAYLFPMLEHLTRHTEQHTKPALPTSTAITKADYKRNQSIASLSVGVTTQSLSINHPSQLTVPVDKLPSFIQVPSQIADVAFTAIPRCMLQMFGSSPGLLKELALQSTVEKLVESIPPPWRKEVLSERIKRHGEETPFGLFLKLESARMSECLQAILNSLRKLQDILTTTSKGDVLLESTHLVGIAFSLLTLSVPKCWLELVGPSAPPSDWPLKEWVQDLVFRFAFLDRVLIGGLAKTPTYWLGAFFNPQAFLSVVQQSVMKSLCGKTGALEQFTFCAELTSRDKDHIRDPPPEGEVFIYGVNLWGCGFEKSASLDMQDIPPKGQVPASLPVLHLSLCNKSQSIPDQQQAIAALTTVDNKGPRIYLCPCFVTNTARSEADCGVNTCDQGGGNVLFTLTVSSCEVAPLKWTSRNLACTLRPF